MQIAHSTTPCKRKKKIKFKACEAFKTAVYLK